LNGQKLKGLLQSETPFAKYGRHARSLSKEKGNAAICLRWVTQASSGSDDAASQGRQDNDFEAPQATQSAVLFPFPD
jgi:hypothetical protein